MPPTALTAQDLTKRRLPDLKYNDASKRTRTLSGSPHTFVGLMAKWENFEMEVRTNYHSQNWKNHALVYESGTFFDSREQVKCAIEGGVVGRFEQQVGHVMTCVGLDLEMKLYFGDYYGSHETIPDLTIWDENTQALVAGEAKTPWTLDLRRTMELENTSDHETFMTSFTWSAGQVANYMKELGFKYGYLTTYEETVFFKQEQYTFKGEMAKVNDLADGTVRNVFWYSNSIHHTTKSDRIPGNPNSATPSPLAYRDKVSLRECMLYLMRKVEGDGNHLCANKDGMWTKKGSVPTPLAKALKYPINKFNATNSSSSSASQSHASSSQQTQSRGGAYSTQRPTYPGQQQHYRSTDDRGYYPPTDQKHQYYSNGADPLADKMSGLHLKERSAENASVQGRKKLSVRWDARHKEYLYTTPSGKQRAVDTYMKTQDGDLWVKINGEKYPAIKVN